MPLQNHLLASLPIDVRSRLIPYLEHVSMPQGTEFYESGVIRRHVYFPIDCILSLIYMTSNGSSTGVSVVGNEGMIGVCTFMGGGTSPGSAVVLSGGSAYRLSVEHIVAEFSRNEAVQRLLLRYTQATIMQLAQTAVCNRHHSIDQHFCRWLLFALDCSSGNQLTVTHELVSHMLGVRREGVTAAAGRLQRMKVIEYSRGFITVLNRPRLEALCCECYGEVKTEIDRLMPYRSQPKTMLSMRTSA